ncbi:hypothetical protein KZO01_01530 [Kurthia zopfii]|uniref:CopG family transcriptional regulator/antitoxin EndoAI n=1 Tax=Kurthia zopfii TaxID=1650 RepID=A0A8B4QE25_9BACL|nr:transcriptional regulator [Kurthia zopfii]TDR42217.1 CopG family transcriptional regulator/antitoxin EndoAI [Kurthia zopfii]GEK29844.1 hypothetical protein KZO01_01530 [Kurthia zopfii]STX10864.1 EndoA inhibitor [Kurthia zopfii]VEI05769.1 EndoA inhibitor [Kurthia zopfii]
MVQNNVKEAILQVSSSFISENIEEAYKEFGSQTEETLYIPTKKVVEIKQKNDMRDAMVKGYEEMSQINLSICSECLHLEYEAEHMVERLVCGG